MIVAKFEYSNDDRSPQKVSNELVITEAKDEPNMYDAALYRCVSGVRNEIPLAEVRLRGGDRIWELVANALCSCCEIRDGLYAR